MKEKIKRDNVFPINLLKWNIDKKELENQVKNYSRLGFFRALRKVSAGLLIFAAIITLLTVIIGWASGKSMVDVILALILAFFVYKGNRVALATAMIYWTFKCSYEFCLLGVIYGSVLASLSGRKREEKTNKTK